MQTAMTGTAWLFMLVTVALLGWALWLGWMGISAPHKAFREGGHAPGTPGAFDAHRTAPSRPQAPQKPMGHVA
jgi:hypothetical protein